MLPHAWKIYFSVLTSCTSSLSVSSFERTKTVNWKLRMKPPDVFCIIDEQTNLAKAVKYGILSKVPEFRYSRITPNCKIIFPLVGSYYLVISYYFSTEAVIRDWSENSCLKNKSKFLNHTEKTIHWLPACNVTETELSWMNVSSIYPKHSVIFSEPLGCCMEAKYIKKFAVNE